VGMPQIPKAPHRPDKKEVIIDLLESIALEEIALSHVLNAEAEKIQAFVGKCLDFPTKPNNYEIIKFNKSVRNLIETVVMKEWLLLKKLEDVLEFLPPIHDAKPCCPTCKGQEKHHDRCQCPVCKEHEKHHHVKCPPYKQTENPSWKGYQT